MAENQFYTILTDIGREKFRDALQGRPIRLTEIAVGDGGGAEVDPQPGMTGLVNEVYRAPITDNTVDPENPAYAILNLVIPIHEGGWHVREAGVFDEEGDLIFIGSMPQTYKPKPSMGVASDLSINLIIDIQRADTVIIQVDPSTVLASRTWTERAIQEALDERCRIKAGGDITVFLREAGNDENSGLSEEHARGTMEGILHLLASLDLGRYSVTVDIGPGTFSAPSLYGSPVLASTDDRAVCVFRGAGKEMTTLTGHVLALNCHFQLEEMNIAGGVRACDNGTIWLRSLRITGTGNNAIYAYRGGNVQIRDNNVEVEGSFAHVIQVILNGMVYMEKGYRLAISGPVHCTIFCRVTTGGTVCVNGDIQLDQEVIGRKWSLHHGGMLCLNGRDPDHVFPGTIKGEATSAPGLANIQPTGMRRRASSDVVIHVRQDGKDDNDGLTEETAKRTLDGAYDALSRIDLGRNTGSIQIGPGRFSLGNYFWGNHAPLNGTPGMFTLWGSGKDETVLEGTYRVYNHPGVCIRNLTVEGTLQFADSSIAFLIDLRVRGTGGRGIYGYRNSMVKIDSGCELEGEFTRVLEFDSNSFLEASDRQITISGQLTCERFAFANLGGTIFMSTPVKNPELVSGYKWWTQDGGILICFTDPDTIFPGDKPGYGHPTRQAIASIIPTDCLTKSLAQTGYAKMPGGLIMQWGRVSMPKGDNAMEITFPLAFPNAAFAVFTDDHVTHAATNPTALRMTGHGDMSKTGFTLISDATDSQIITWQAYGN